MMHKKLRLNMDDLAVETFVPSAGVQVRGTVNGEQTGVPCPSTSLCGTNPIGCVDSQAPSYCASPESCDWTHCVNLSCVANCTANTCVTDPNTDPLYTMRPQTCVIRECPVDPE